MTLVSRMGRILAMCACAALSNAYGAESYPSKPIRLIVPFPPGGSIDPVARLIGPKLAERWGQPVVVDNRPGANGSIGTDLLAKAAPDGHTLVLLGGSTHVANALLKRNLPYDSFKDFAPVATIERADYVLVVHPSLPARTLKELVALAKAKPDSINYASSGNGNLNHLAAELFNIMTGIKTHHVPFKGGGQALTNLVGGQVQMHFSVTISAISFIKSGRLKALAIGGDARFPALPQVPTFTEAGLAGFSLRPWQGIMAPARTPRPIIGQLSTEIGRILELRDIKDKLTSLGMTPMISTPEQFAAIMESDKEKIAKVIKTANIRVD